MEVEIGVRGDGDEARCKKRAQEAPTSATGPFKNTPPRRVFRLHFFARERLAVQLRPRPPARP